MGIIFGNNGLISKLFKGQKVEQPTAAAKTAKPQQTKNSAVTAKTNEDEYVECQFEEETPKEEKKSGWKTALTIGGFLLNPVGTATALGAKKVAENEDVQKFVKDTVEDGKELVDKGVAKAQEGLDYLGYMNDVTAKSFSGADNFGDWINKQNYIANNIIADGFSFEKLEDLSDSYEFIRDSRKEGPKFIQSEKLSDEEEQEAREYAYDLMLTRLAYTVENMPDYGDVRSYYNEGSMMDWVVSHPVSFGADAGAEAIGADWYTTFSQEWLGQDGMFTPLNIGNYIEKGCTDENQYGIRNDYYTDMLSIRSTENINEDIAAKFLILEELKNSLDDPEKFAEIYYKASDGVNFDPDRVMEYKEAVEANAKIDEAIAEGKEAEEKKDVAPLNTIIGRNYISEDFAKNEMGTNIAYEVNKSVGTKLACSIPFVGPLVAGVVNVGVSALEEKTQEDNEMTAGDWTKLILKEGVARPLAFSSSKIVKNIKGADKLGTNGQNMAAGMISEGAYTTAELTGDIINGNGGAIIGDIAELSTNPKAASKTTFKFLLSKLLRKK